jgi:hypothetical protein
MTENGEAGRALGAVALINDLACGSGIRRVHAGAGNSNCEPLGAVHRLGDGSRDDQLIDCCRRRREYVMHVEVGAADLAIGLNRQNPPEKILVFSVQLSKSPGSILSVNMIGLDKNVQSAT